MPFDRRASSAVRADKVAAELRSVDDGKAHADVIFKTIDKDGDGSIDANEFAVMYDGIKAAIIEEHTVSANAKRRAKVLCGVVALLGFFGIVLLVANSFLTYYVVDLSKDSKISNGALVGVDDADAPVKTEAASYYEDLLATIELAKDQGTTEEVSQALSGITQIMYDEPAHHAHEDSLAVSKVSSVIMANGVVLADLASGASMMINPTTAETAGVSAPVGLITFNSAGTSNIVMRSTFKVGTEADLATAAHQICVDAGCPNAECTATIALPTALHSVMCQSVAIWKWSDAMTMPTQPSGRMLWGSKTRRRHWRAAKRSFTRRSRIMKAAGR